MTNNHHEKCEEQQSTYLEMVFAERDTLGLSQKEQEEILMLLPDSNPMKHEYMDNKTTSLNYNAYYNLQTSQEHMPFYHVSYPDEWQLPDRFSHHYQQIEVKKFRYIPYKRISHFREHLNRLQYCQEVSIPNEVWMEVCHFLSLSAWDQKQKENLYYAVKEMLQKKQYSRFNEHIHFMLSKYFGDFLDIRYEDHVLMCKLFLAIETEFQKRTKKDITRKNMISYYIIVQIILYLFHYHPKYKLPTVHDEWKRQLHYITILKIIQSLPDYEKILRLHFKRKRDCEICCTYKNLFDPELQQLL